jgi:hypothetical protein
MQIFDIEISKGHLMVCGLMIAICIFAVVVAPFLDMGSAIKKNRKLSPEMQIESAKLRRTIDKMLKYFSFIVFGVIFDTFIMGFCLIYVKNFAYPFITIALTMFCCYTEFRSIREAADIKNGNHFIKDIKDLSKNISELKENLNIIKN